MGLRIFYGAIACRYGMACAHSSPRLVTVAGRWFGLIQFVKLHCAMPRPESRLLCAPCLTIPQSSSSSDWRLPRTSAAVWLNLGGWRQASQLDGECAAAADLLKAHTQQLKQHRRLTDDADDCHGWCCDVQDWISARRTEELACEVGVLRAANERLEIQLAQRCTLRVSQSIYHSLNRSLTV